MTVTPLRYFTNVLQINPTVLRHVLIYPWNVTSQSIPIGWFASEINENIVRHDVHARQSIKFTIRLHIHAMNYGVHGVFVLHVLRADVIGLFI